MTNRQFLSHLASKRASQPSRKMRRALAPLFAIAFLCGCHSTHQKTSMPIDHPSSASDSVPNSTDTELNDIEARFEKLMRRMDADAKPSGGREAYQVARVPGRASVLGVYPVKAAEPCCLVEMQIEDSQGFDLGDITQAVAERGRSFWQAPYEEVLLDGSGTKVMAGAYELGEKPSLLRGMVRIAFFFHYLNTQESLLTPFGDLPLPKPTDRPRRLKMLKYEAPF